MIKTTIGTILAEEVDAGDDKRIYLIRDDGFPIYIGQATYVCERITDHCGLGPRFFQPDQLGNFILNNQPNSLKWQVDLLTLDECELIARLHFPSYLHFDIDSVEQALIIAFGPCLNTFHNQNNPNRRPIPDKYITVEMTKQFRKWNKNDFLATKANIESQFNNINIKNAISQKLIVQNVFFQYRQHLSPHTIRSLDSVLVDFREYIENTKTGVSNLNIIDDPNAWITISAELIINYIQWSLKKGFAISTINQRISFLKKYATIAFQAGALPENEWKLISIIKNYYGGRAKKIDTERTKQDISGQIRKKAQVILLADEQAQSLKNFPETSPDERRTNLIMCLLLDQGLQATDFSKLKVEDFDLVLEVLNLERPNIGKQVHKLSDDSLRALRCVLDNHDIKTFGPLGFRVWKNGKIIQQPISPPVLRYYVRNAGKFIGIENLTVQQCRSYWVRKEVETGTNILDIQSKGGWTNIQSVLRNIKRVENEK